MENSSNTHNTTNTNTHNNNNKPPKNSFLKFLPKAASVVSFQNPQFSPGRDHHHHNHHHHHHNHHHHHHHHNNHHNSGKFKAHTHKGFSGPINFSVLPEEARVKPQANGSYEAHEPTSPKVSCMGQIKRHKHKQIKKLTKIVSKTNNNNNKLDHHHDTNININNNNNKKKKKKNNSSSSSSSSSSISKFFTRSSKGTNSSSNDDDHGKNGRVATLDHDHNNNNNKVNAHPSLGKMNKFASGRESSLADFDWTAQIAPLDHDRDCYYSDDEERRRDHDHDDHDHNDDDGDEVIIPYSAPIVLVGGRSSFSNQDDDDDDDVNVIGDLEPRKEVNLWKRRTMAPPPPLALNSIPTKTPVQLSALLKLMVELQDRNWFSTLSVHRYTFV